MYTRFATKKARVQLHKECLDFGGREVYPHNSVVTTGLRDSERLVYCKLGHAFFGFDGKQKVRRTDNSHGMWIPEWLLVPIFEAA